MPRVADVVTLDVIDPHGFDALFRQLELGVCGENVTVLLDKHQCVVIPAAGLYSHSLGLHSVGEALVYADDYLLTELGVAIHEADPIPVVGSGFALLQDFAE